ncbi:hypothetical protein D3C84_830120 [compost metagenome]
MPGFAYEGFGEQPATAIGPIQHIASTIGNARLQGAGPGVITHTIDLLRPVPTPGFGQALWISLIEQRHARGGEGVMGGVDIHRQLRPAIAGFQQAHQRVDHVQ